MRAVETLHVHRLGRAAYGPTHDLQRRLVEARVQGLVPDILLLVEHDPPVVTLGRAAKEQNLLFAPALLAMRGIEVHETGRGGDVTYHGPGQVVAYPIVRLSPDREDVRRYVATLEETMIRTCADYGVVAGRVEGMNGAWVQDRKIGAVGVRISRWVTMHGLALNVNTDLSHFDVIVPCGIRDKAVTSLEKETGAALPFAEVADRIARHFGEQYDAKLVFHDGPPTLPPSPPSEPSP